ncbi:MAG: methyltransferase domain-containing protein [Candidatus Falkowbacteria bacterium]|nr:methyltransferase domain-containing protein [Candidatus Falkowbacteria bacterium]
MLEYENVSDKLVRQMLVNAHNPRRAKIRTKFLREEYKFLNSRIKNEIVLAAGCGLGHEVFVLAKNNSWVIGVDIIESLVDEARSTALKKEINNVSFICSDFLKLDQLNVPFNSILLNMGTICNFDDIAYVVEKLLSYGEKLYFDFYSSKRSVIAIRKKMYEEEAWSKLRVSGAKIINECGFESKAFSKKYIKGIIDQLGFKVRFYPICNFAYMAEVWR